MRFIEEGSHVVVLDRDAALCAAVNNEMPDLSGVITTDVTDRDEVQRAFEKIDSLFAGVDVLVNNAVISIRHPFMDITLEEWQQVLDVNLTGVFLYRSASCAADVGSRRGRDPKHMLDEWASGLSVVC